MKKNKLNLLWILRIVLLIALFLLIYWYYLEILSPDEICAVACQKPSHIIQQYVIIFLSILILGISAMIKPHIDSTTIIVSAILLLLLIFVFIIMGVVVNCPNPQGCYIPGLVCQTMLHSGTSELDLALSNRIGHNISVNGIKCVRVDSWDEVAGQQSFIEQLRQPVILRTELLTNVTGFNITNKLYCTNADGSIPTDTPIGKFDCFRLYINYTDLVDGSSIITSGALVERYTW